MFEKKTGRPDASDKKLLARLFGIRGEDRAAKYLKKRKYRILDRNARYKGGEIDIVAMDGNELVFVEVKARKEGSLVSARDAVGYRKMKCLFFAAQCYIAQHHLEELPARFDVIAIDGDRIEHIVNAFTK